jgi:hypothetical protein
LSSCCDGPLPVDLFLLQLGVEEHVGGHVDSGVELVEGHDIPVARELFVRVGVQRAARALDLLCDDDGVGALLGALETMCSRKWVMPFSRLGSDREPTPTNRFTDTACVVGIGVVTIRIPFCRVASSHLTAIQPPPRDWRF